MSTLTFVFNERYSYPYNEILRKHGGKFNPVEKIWDIPLLNKKKFLDDRRLVDQQLRQKSEKIWQESCLDCGVKFCKKGSDEYLQVLELFKLKMKN